MKKITQSSWDNILSIEFNKDYFLSLESFLDKEYKEKIIYPKEEDVFNAFKLTNYNNLKVILLGQDPYINENEAMGLSFSVPSGTKIPPSLRNIYKELSTDLNINIPKSGDLSKLAEEGVLLLNTILTVEKKKSLSHKNIGWETFTDNILKYINSNKDNLVIILLGDNAIKKEKIFTNNTYLILKSTHPSPLSAYRGFLGSKIFSKTNEYLRSKSIKEINWNILNEN